MLRSALQIDSAVTQVAYTRRALIQDFVLVFKTSLDTSIHPALIQVRLSIENRRIIVTVHMQRKLYGTLLLGCLVPFCVAI